MPILADALMEGHEALLARCAQCDRAVAADRQPHGGQGIEHGAVRGRDVPALHIPQAIGKKAQGALGGDVGIELPDRASRRVARVHEGLLALFALGFVELFEIIAAHVDLATHLQHGRLDALEVHGDLADRVHVVGDVLACFAVAARGGLSQLAVFIAQVDGQPVELELGGVLDGRVFGAQAQFAADAGIEGFGAGGLRVGLGADGQHRHGMPHRRQAIEHLSDDALRG